MRPIVVSVGPLATASANNIALSQTPSFAVTINGSAAANGVATLDTARKVLITAAANESAKTFTIVGTNWSGSSISETVAGPNATTATSVLDYKTVSSVTISAAAAGAITIGTTTVAASPWVRLDEWAANSTVAQCNVTGTVSYTVQQTSDDPNSPTNPVAPAAMTWINSADTNVVNATATQQTVYAYTPLYARILLNSGSGSVVATFTQSGNVHF